MDILSTRFRLIVRRLRCVMCGKLHTELPDIVLPYKHYSCDVITQVIDKTDESMSCAADDSTMRRWNTSFAAQKTDMGQRTLAHLARENNTHIPLPSENDIWKYIRERHPRWLAFVMRLLINSGERICTQFAFCPENVADKVYQSGTSVRQKGGENDKTVNDTG